MTPDLQRRVQRYGWDRAASSYEPSWKAQLAPAQEKMLEWAELGDFEQVMDVACGTGLVTFAAARQVGPWGKVLATDLSDEMVAYVHAEAHRRKAGQVLARQMDKEVLDAPDIFPIVDARMQTDVCPLFFQLGTGNTLQEEFGDAGFTQVRATRLSTTLHYDSPEAACEAAFEGGPVALASSRFDDPMRTETRAEYLASIAPYRTGNAYAIPGEFVVVRGDKA